MFVIKYWLIALQMNAKITHEETHENKNSVLMEPRNIKIRQFGVV